MKESILGSNSSSVIVQKKAGKNIQLNLLLVTDASQTQVSIE